VRILSVVGLLLVFSSSIFVMVNDIRAVNNFMANQGASQALTDCDYIADSSVPNQAAGVFWAVLNRLLILLETVVLLMAELSPPLIGRFFDQYFPVLGPSFGLGALGIFQCLIGATILSHHVDDFTLVAAFFLFSIGCLNMLVGLVFRERAKEYRSIPAFRTARKDVLPHHVEPSARAAQPPFFGSGFHPDEKVEYGYGASDKAARYEADYRAIAASRAGSPQEQWAGYGFGRQGEKAAGLKGFLISKPTETLPRYAPSHASAPRSRPESVASSSRASSSTRAGSDHESDRGRSERPRLDRLVTSSTQERSVSPASTYHSEDNGSAAEESRPSSRGHTRHEMPIPTYLSSPTAL
jgi:hypothetical protein